MRALVGILCLTTTGFTMADSWPAFDDWWDYGDPAATEVRFRELLAREPPDLDYRIQLTTQLARALGLQSKFTDATALLESARPALARASAETRVRWLLEHGRVLNSSGQPEQARLVFEEAWVLGREAGADGFAVDAGHMIAIVSEGREGVAWNERLIVYAEKSSNPAARRWLGSLYNNLGWGYFDLEDYAAALAAHRKGEMFFAGGDEPDRLRIARWSVAKQLRFLDRCAEALEINTALEQEWRDVGEQDGYVYEELGECLLLQGKGRKARVQFARAHALLSADEWLAASEPDRLARLERLAADTPEA
jgi:tetratricopeptide (TPR) repeat protein